MTSVTTMTSVTHHFLFLFGKLGKLFRAVFRVILLKLYDLSAA